jgi:hypothetical protein
MTDRYLSAENLSQDDFEQPFTKLEDEVVYDAKTRLGPWATMTEASWKVFGIGRLGLGLGQKYVRNAAGQLHKVAG